MSKLQNLNYFLSGEITSLKGEPLNGLTVRAYDKDPVSPDDALGSAVTDEAGLYSIQFTTKDFQTGGFERSGPDVYINVFSGEDLLGISKIQNNSPVKITIDLKVDDSNIKKDSGSGNPLPPVDPAEELDAAKLKRLDILNSVTTDIKIKEAISDAFKVAQGDWTVAKEAMKKTGIDEALLNKFDFINSLGDVTNDTQNLVTVLMDLPGISNLRDLALTHNTKSLAAILEKDPLANNNFGDPKTDAIFSADSIMRNIFAIETSAVLQRMATAGELPIEKKLSDAVAGFLSNQPEFNIRTTSIYNALKHPEAFKDIADKDQEAVTAHLKTLQRVQAISSSPEAVSALVNANLLSANQVAEMPPSNFVSVLSISVGEAEATKIHARATDSKVRNEQTLINFSEWVKGTNIAAIDGTTDKKARIAILNATAGKKEIPLNWESLFGDVDLCECCQCNSVYSPAAYFVELLQYLRNNNLDPGATGGQAIRVNPNDITGTVLEKFFDRRPDLGCLELSCKNANTLLPYIDLVNEVMESFVVHLHTTTPLHRYTEQPAKAEYEIDPCNVEDETSEELLAEPQHTNLNAYQILKNAVYPFQLPYHQPIDVIRTLLKFMGVDRHELITAFAWNRSTKNRGYELPEGNNFGRALIASPDANLLTQYNNNALEIAADAEYLGLTEEEFVILAKEGFWSMEYFSAKYLGTITNAYYRKKIGLWDVWTYYCYDSENSMIRGLPMVKDEFMKRTGLAYLDLVEMLKTEFINPQLPDENSQRIMASLSYSYRELMPLVGGDLDNPPLLIIDLQKLVNISTPAICPPRIPERTISLAELENWFSEHFRDVGECIVLDSGETLMDVSSPSIPVFINSVYSPNVVTGNKVTKPAIDTCDLTKVRLMHLDGTLLSTDEYDKMHRFIRLWRKLGWTMKETDRAIMGLGFTGGIHGVNDITPILVQQLAAVKRLQADTGLELTMLMTFWSLIETRGEDSLYARLFLRPNIRNLDNIFQKDAAYLASAGVTIADHIPALKAAFNLKQEDIDAICNCAATNGFLTLPNVSIIYRHALFMRLININSKDLASAKHIFGDPFTKATETINTLSKWARMEDAGFTFQQIQYLVTDPAAISVTGNPLEPGGSFFSNLMDTLRDGLEVIDNAHPDLSDGEIATPGFVREQLALLYDSKTAGDIEALLEGTTIYTTTTTIGLVANEANFTPRLKAQFRYNSNTGQLQIIGILRDDLDLIPVLPAPDNEIAGWMNAIGRIYSQADSFFDEVLIGIFSDAAEARNMLLERSDVHGPIGIDPFKRAFFIKQFLPFLRKKLKQKFLIETMSGLVGVDKEMTAYLITEGLYSTLLIEHTAPTPNDTVQAPIAEAFEKNSQNSLYLNPAFVKLQKAAILVNGFRLTTKEMRYLILHSADFGIFDFPGFTLDTWLRLEAYTRLRNSLPKTETDLISFFEWTSDPSSLASLLSNKIAVLTQWTEPDIANLIAAGNFNLTQPDFRDEKNLLKLQRALAIKARINTSIDKLFEWANPVPAFDRSSEIADDIRLTLKARYRETDWEQVVKPINDQIRRNQRNALVSYLLQQQSLQEWGATDANSLFEFFLIDVQMDACMQTSRIKQAINSVQLYVQRCFLNLERNYGVESNTLSRGRWEWMQRNVLWEANRKVFLYPENWIEEELRDDKSSFFKELESELLQKDINKQTVTDALKSYLYKLDEVANMQVVGVYVENTAEPTHPIIHVFSRTRNAPYFFYYRRYDDGGNWTPWEKVQVDIPSYDVEGVEGDDTQPARNGCYLIPVVLDNRLFIFFPQLMKKMKSNDSIMAKSVMQLAMDQSFSLMPSEYWEIKMGWSEYRDGKWTPKQVSKDIIEDMPIGLEGFIPNSPDLYNAINARGVIDFAQNTLNDATTAVVDTTLVLALVNGAIIVAEEAAWASMPPILIAIEAAVLYSGVIAGFRLNASNTNTAAIDFFNHAPLAIQELSRQSMIAAGTANTAAVDLTINTHEISLDGGFSPVPSGNYTQLMAQMKSLSDAATDAVKLATTFQTNAEKALAAANAVFNKVNTLISNFEFIPVISAIEPRIEFEISKLSFDGIRLEQLPKSFKFSGNHIIVDDARITHHTHVPRIFHYLPTTDGPTLASLQETGMDSAGGISVFGNLNFLILDNRIVLNPWVSEENFYHPYSHQFLSEVNSGDMPEFFEQPILNTDLNSDKMEAFGKIGSENYNELKTPYSIYNWELFFHTPVILADRLSKSQHFEEAMKWYHFVFNPMAPDDLSANPAWRFLPFKEQSHDNYLESLFYHLAPNTANDDEINPWRDNPYAPHAVARKRPTAYMKWVVMKYLDNLIAWGDYLFRQDTIESINQATQLYVLANHILGSRPEAIPKRGKIKAETYNSLLDRWDAFGNAMVKLELIALYSDQGITLAGKGNDKVAHTNLFGTASSLYFCIPDNPKLTAYWDIIDDRLYKIRHCENIDGVFSLPPLWDAAIDPALLVQATAQGLDLANVLNDLDSPMPNYRFNYLLQKALELCNELKSMGGSLLSVLEKKDGEILARMRAGHESNLHNRLMEIKKFQMNEAGAALDGLVQNRKSPVYRLRHYLQLIGEDMDNVPAEDADFMELVNRLDPPIDESGLKLSAYEKEEMDKANAAADWQLGIGVVETLGAILNLIPSFKTDLTPGGVGAGLIYGGINIGNALQATARGMQVYASYLSHQSSSAQRKGGFQRALQDRIFQANLAGLEIKQIDKQITSQKIRLQIAAQEITNQQKQIDNSNEVEAFLKDKYTNTELYFWMENSIKSVHQQVYTLAYDLAKKAERAFQFERGLSTSNFIQFGSYWDASHEGMHSGERLYVGLKQLEAAYHERRGWDYEVTKHVSISQVDPLTLMSLKETGACEFELPEDLFDLDFPGHYMRRIKSVSLTMPCVAGPYTSVNATLRLVENKFRLNAIAVGAAGYPEKMDEVDVRFTTKNVPVTSIATSSGQNDSGVFELNFKDERYMPFEGAGAISKWRLEMMSVKNLRQFDYDTISDVILHIRYTAREDASLKNASVDNLKRLTESLKHPCLLVFTTPRFP